MRNCQTLFGQALGRIFLNHIVCEMCDTGIQVGENMEEPIERLSSSALQDLDVTCASQGQLLKIEGIDIGDEMFSSE